MIALLNDYYQIDSRVADGDSTLFDVTLLSGYCAYAGHFQGNPVSPGVCNIQMIKECAGLLAGKRLVIACIDKCKFFAVINPQTSPHLKIRMQLCKEDTMYKVQAVIFDDQLIKLILKVNLLLSDDTFFY